MIPNEEFQPPPPPSPGTPAPTGPTMSTGETITGIFFEPGRVFESMRERPRFLIAGVIIAVAIMVFTTLFFQRVGYDRVVREGAENSSRFQQLTPEQQEQQLRIQSSPIVKAIYFVLPLLFTAIILAAGGALYLLGSMLMAKQITYKQALAVWSYASLPPITISMLLNVVLLFLKSPDDYDIVSAQRHGLVKANLGWLADPKSSPMLATALGSIDLFAFYGLFLAAIGLRKVGKMSSGSAWGIVLTFWAIFLVLRIAMAGIFGQAM